MRLLALDIGDKRIGVAKTDALGRIAYELTILNNDNRAIEKVRALLDEHRIEKVLVGLPKTLSGKLGEQADKTKQFVQRLQSLVSIEFEYIDERFSTIAARKELERMGLKAARHAERIDMMTAKILLDDYLSRDQ